MRLKRRLEIEGTALHLLNQLADAADPERKCADLRVTAMAVQALIEQLGAELERLQELEQRNVREDGGR